MKKIIITCDACKQEKTANEVKGIEIKWNNGYGLKSMDVCIPCLTKFKLIKEDGKQEPIDFNTPAETLLELIEEIARNAVQE